MHYKFEWDSTKAQLNFHKHKIIFEKAITIFRDPNTLSIYDEKHSHDDEERWITMGLNHDGILLVVVHTFEQMNESVCNIRIISARKATQSETRQYLG